MQDVRPDLVICLGKTFAWQNDYTHTQTSYRMVLRKRKVGRLQAAFYETLAPSATRARSASLLRKALG